MNSLNALAVEGKINENASIRDQHSTIINAPIEKVWAILSDLENWPNWNSDVKKIELSGKVEEGAKFQWTIGRLKANSQIQHLHAPNTLTWTGKTNWVKRIYVWSLEPDDKKTIVTVSTSLQGFLTVLVENHQRVYNELLNWLETLKNKAEGE